MALIKKGGTSRLDAAKVAPPSAEDSAAPEQADEGTRTLRSQSTTEAEAASAIIDEGTHTLRPADEDSTRALRTQATTNGSRTVARIGTEAIRQQAPEPDATRTIKPAQNHDETRTIQAAANGTRATPRIATEAIRRHMQQQPADAPTAQSPSLQPGTTLEERYVIEDVIGIGGMSVVYRGRDLRFKEVTRYCAIKEMYQNSPDSQTRLLSFKNFEREAGLLATLNHPAIPKVYDFFQEHGRAYLVLELIPGADLETVLEQTTEPLNEVQVGRWAIQICDVLSYLHHHEPEPIIFRDLKPSNMIVSTNDRVVLIDFGIARIFTRTDKKGTMIGTEGYSPPEQYRGIAEARGDVYALGATLHHLLSAADPRLETPFTFHDRPLRQLNPDISPEMEAVVMKALEYDATKRWNSAEEFKQALLQVPGLAANTGVAVAPTAPGMPALLKGAQGTELVWKFKCEEEIRSSPTVQGGNLYVGCYDTNLYAIDIKRGSFLWKKATNSGISSSPAVWKDIVIVGSDDGNVYAFDARQGTQRWVFRTEKAVRSSPRALDRLVYVGSDDQHLYAIDGSNGRLIWRYRAWQWIRSSACVHEDMVIFGAGDGNMYAIDAMKGSPRWKQKLSGGIISSAAVTDKLVIVGCMDYNLHGLDLEGGWPIWKFRTNHYVNSSPVVLGNRVFVGGIDGQVYAVDTKKGKPVWQYDAGDQVVSSPVLDGGRLYIGSADGVVHCLDVSSGSPLWIYHTDGPIVATPAVADGVVFIGSLDHHVYALKG